MDALAEGAISEFGAMDLRESMQIAPGVTAGEWLALRLDAPGSCDWEKAIAIFDARIRARYLEPVEILVRLDESKPAMDRRFGFTILAIDVLLVETLQAFRLGLDDTRNQSGDMFRRFLAERSRFSQYFDRDIARRFFDDVRCGILHQAEVRGGWRVWSVGPLLAPAGSGFTINRTTFHGYLVAEFEDYKKELSEPSQTDLRENFRRKMQHICTET